MSYDYKLDFSEHVLDPKKAQLKESVFSATVEQAIKKVAALNEKTAEQVLIVELQKALKQQAETIKQLQARIGRLEQGVDAAYQDAVLSMMNDDARHYKLLLNESSQQSLAHIKADGVDEYGKVAASEIDGITPEEYANQLRNKL